MQSKDAPNNAVQTEYVCMENAFVEQAIVDSHAVNYHRWVSAQKQTYSCLKTTITA